MYTVYVLQSRNYNWFYVGLTEKVDHRLKQHNNGKVRSTKYRRPYSLIYTRTFKSRVEARDFEKYLKIRTNKEKLLELL